MLSCCAAVLLSLAVARSRASRAVAANMAQVCICSYGKRFPGIRDCIEEKATKVVDGLRLQRNPEQELPLHTRGWHWECLVYVPRAQQEKNACHVIAQNQLPAPRFILSVLCQIHVLSLKGTAEKF